MLVGILTDIHDAVTPLRGALAVFAQHGVDQVVTLGDAFDSYRPGEPAVEVAKLLDAAGAAGVWGNHDVGLSMNVSSDVRAAADPLLLAFAARLQPQLSLGGHRFCHIEPWRDPRQVADLWAFDGPPDTDVKAQRSFDVVEERASLIGHFHCWLAMSQSRGRMAWDGTAPISLGAPERYLFVVGALVEGWCAMLDTTNQMLTPVRCPLA